MMPQVVVVGGGIAGAATALMLADRGLDVTLIERDSAATIAYAHAHDGWRPGVRHGAQPHALLAGGTDVLTRFLPRVADSLYARGARDAVEFPGADVKNPPVLALRRSLLESSLYSELRVSRNVRLMMGHSVEEVILSEDAGKSVVAVRTGSNVILPAQIVVDAQGTYSKPLIPIASYWGRILRSRWYYVSMEIQLSARAFGAVCNAAAIPLELKVPGVGTVRLFLHDPPYASLLTVFDLETWKYVGSRSDAIRSVLLSVLSDPGLELYLDGSEASMIPRIQGRLWTRAICLPQVASYLPDGFYVIGDALAFISPHTSRGAGLALIAARDLAHIIGDQPWDQLSQRKVLTACYRDWLLPNWADAVVSGGFEHQGVDMPSELSAAIDSARQFRSDIAGLKRRGRSFHSENSSNGSSDTLLEARVLRRKTGDVVLSYPH